MKIVTFFIYKQLYLHHNRAPYPYIIIMKLSPMRGFIPMRPDLLRFIQWRENLEPDEYLPLPGKGFFSAYLTNLCISPEQYAKRAIAMNIPPA
jgi:hypothetical protein